MLLKEYGLEKLYAKGFDKNNEKILGRIIAQYNKIYTIISEAGEKKARVSGRFIHETVKVSDFPVVGGWVELRKGTDDNIIESVIPRMNHISRSAAGKKRRDFSSFRLFRCWEIHTGECPVRRRHSKDSNNK